MNKLLINAKYVEEVRIALVKKRNQDYSLEELDIEYLGHERKKYNIYKGVISDIRPNLEALFINYGEEKNGFLPFKEISRKYFNKNEKNQLLLKQGDEILVQVKIEERDHKGAVLTTFIVIPGNYFVLIHGNNRISFSKNMQSENRTRIEEMLKVFYQSKDFGIIVRTVAFNASFDTLQEDYNFLSKKLTLILDVYHSKSGAFLIFKEGDIVTKTLRDYMKHNIDEVVIDNAMVYQYVSLYLKLMQKNTELKLVLYDKDEPLFSYFNIENDIASVFQNEIRLASGATVVFNQLEAFVAVDVNSGASLEHKNVTDMALGINKEAVEVIAQHIRLRDLSGIIVIDFIDMATEEDREQIEKCMKKATERDKAKTQIGSISIFGLLEMSRQRTRLSLSQPREIVCKTCLGNGKVMNVTFFSTAIIREIERLLSKNKIPLQIVIHTSNALAMYMNNMKRILLSQLENTFNTKIILMAHMDWSDMSFEINSSTTVKEKQVVDREMMKKNNTLHPVITQSYLLLAKKENSIFRRFWQKLKFLLRRMFLKPKKEKTRSRYFQKRRPQK